jgi:hypothetical protein
MLSKEDMSEGSQSLEMLYICELISDKTVVDTKYCS